MSRTENTSLGRWSESSVMKSLMQIVDVAESKSNASTRASFRNLEDAFSYLRVLVLYLKFDLEATMRERNVLSKMLEKTHNKGK